MGSVHGNQLPPSHHQSSMSLQRVWTGCLSGHRVLVPLRTGALHPIVIAVCVLTSGSVWSGWKLCTIWIKPLASVEGKWEDGRPVDLWLESNYPDPGGWSERGSDRGWACRAAEESGGGGGRWLRCFGHSQGKRSLQNGWEKKQGPTYWKSQDLMDALLHCTGKCFMAGRLWIESG